MTLAEEVEASRQHIRSDGYSMSIGELTNLYKDSEMVIRPEFQRLFRWTPEKKSRLIESLLLGIPLPSIFVASRDDGVWEVVDGLQRLSTIFEFMGILRDEATGDEEPASQLLATKYLPSLEGKYYDNPDEPENSLEVAERLTIKRAKLDIKILQRESDDSVKFELFDRLNSGGQPTSAQEVRSAQILMTHPEFFRWADTLRQSENFQDSLPISYRQMQEQYDLELCLRFLALYYSKYERLLGFADFDGLLSEQAIHLAAENEDYVEDFDRVAASEVFRGTFDVIAKAGIDAFRRYDGRRGKFAGGFSVSAFEVVTIGVARNLVAWQSEPDAGTRLLDLCEGLWSDERFRKNSGAGIRASQRIPVMVGLGPAYFRP